MDNNSALLNAKWKNYFNWTIIYPTVFFTLFIVAIVGTIINQVSSLGTQSFEHLSNGNVLGLGIVVFGLAFFAFIIAMLVYTVWFVMASDTLFVLLGVNRTLGNVLNIVGLIIFGGLSFFILPIYFWIKMREYWLVRGEKFNWRAVV
jgi:hypothetical protein